jgi:hypothetical protein
MLGLNREGKALKPARNSYGLIACMLVIAIKVVYDLSLGATSIDPNFSADLFNQCLPLYQFVRDSAALDQLPLWNPYVALGTPLIAELGLGLFNPMTWPAFVFDAPLAMFITQLVMILVAVVGMWLFLDSLSLGTTAKIPGSILFGLIVFTNSFLPSLGMSLSILPFILLTANSLVTQPCLRTTAVLSILLALCFFSGFPNYFYYTGLLLGSYALALCLLSHKQNSGAVTIIRLLMLLVSAFLTLLLVAVQLLPTFELSQLSVRSVTSDLMFPEQQSFLRANTGLLLKNFFSAQTFNLYSSESFVVEKGVGYLGVLPAFCVLAFLDDRNRRIVLALLFALMFMALFMIADQVEGLGFMRQIPLAGTLRWHGRISDYIQVVVVILSMIGLSAYLQAASQGAAQSGLPGSSLLKFVFPLFLLLQLYFIYHFNGLSVAFWLAAVICIMFVSLAFLYQASKWALLIASVLVMVMTADLLIHRKNAFLTPFFANADNPYYSASRNPVLLSRIEQIREEDPNNRVLIHGKYPSFGLTEANLGMIHRLSNINSYTGFALASWKEFLSAMVGEETFNNAVLNTPAQLFQGSLNGHLLRQLKSNDSILAVTAVESIVSSRDLKKVDGAFPRVFLTADYEVAGDKEAVLQTIKDRLSTRGPWVILEQAPEELVASAGPFPGSAEIVEYRNNSVKIEAELSHQGLLVLNDAHYPGWRARVDGKDVELLRANFLFRAVALDEGRHTVEFVYRPKSLYIGAAISLISLIAIVYLMRFRRQEDPKIDGE